MLAWLVTGRQVGSATVENYRDLRQVTDVFHRAVVETYGFYHHSRPYQVDELISFLTASRNVMDSRISQDPLGDGSVHWKERRNPIPAEERENTSWSIVSWTKPTRRS